MWFKRELRWWVLPFLDEKTATLEIHTSQLILVNQLNFCVVCKFKLYYDRNVVIAEIINQVIPIIMYLDKLTNWFIYTRENIGREGLD